LYGEGAHSLTIGDCDGDGFDEIVYGSAILDHDGVTVLRTGAGHGDALHLADMDPDREGLEIFMVHEETNSSYKWDATFRDARTGEILWGNAQSGHDIGRGLAANISSDFRGYEVWPNAYYNGSTRANKTFTCTGEIAIEGKVPSSNFSIYWDGDLLDELFDGGYDSSSGKSSPAITKRNNALSSNSATWNLYNYSNAQSCNSTKATPNLQADLFGDWREEIILHDGNTESDLLIFSTTIPTDYRVNTLMQDRQYRVAIAWQNVGYNQPPHLSYNLEEAFNTAGAITVNGGALNQVIYLGDEIQTIGFTVIRATGVKIEGLPEGMTYSFDPATLTGTISGTPNAEGEFTFTITTTGAEEDQNATITGTIKVRMNTSIELVAHYPFEKVGETTPNSILGEIATANGGNGEAVEGKRGNALSLNGSNRYVQEGYDLIDFGSNSFTIELWMNSTAADKNCYLLNKGVISPNNGSGNWYGIE
ncbi:MAG: Por secretion system protein, partial [Duncaniella sp.]|nr:Por secretion system protein [Duncaniella sp.]